MRHAMCVLVLCSCRWSTNFPDPTAGMRFSGAEFGRAHTAETRHVDLPFLLKPEGINGTALLLGFLQQVQPTGATYISGVSYSLQMIYRSEPVECVSKIIVEDGTQPPSAPPPAAAAADDADYSTTIAPWRPDVADSLVVDRELACKTRAVSESHVVRNFESGNDAEVRRNTNEEAWSYTAQDLRFAMGNDLNVQHQLERSWEPTFHEECTLDPKKQRVHRYSHFLAARFAPPDLDLIGKRYSDFRLVEAAPECHRIDRKANTPLRHHISADLHFVGGVDSQHPMSPDSIFSFKPTAYNSGPHFQ